MHTHCTFYLVPCGSLINSGSHLSNTLTTLHPQKVQSSSPHPRTSCSRLQDLRSWWTKTGDQLLYLRQITVQSCILMVLHQCFSRRLHCRWLHCFVTSFSSATGCPQYFCYTLAATCFPHFIDPQSSPIATVAHRRVVAKEEYCQCTHVWSVSISTPRRRYKAPGGSLKQSPLDPWALGMFPQEWVYSARFHPIGMVTKAKFRTRKRRWPYLYPTTWW